MNLVSPDFARLVRINGRANIFAKAFSPCFDSVSCWLGLASAKHNAP